MHEVNFHLLCGEYTGVVSNIPFINSLGRKALLSPRLSVWQLCDMPDESSSIAVIEQFSVFIFHSLYLIVSNLDFELKFCFYSLRFGLTELGF